MEQSILNNSCPICLNMVEEHMKCITQCGHTFHNKCIFRWLRNHNNCPTCRCVLNADSDGETDEEMVTPPHVEEAEAADRESPSPFELTQILHQITIHERSLSEELRPHLLLIERLMEASSVAATSTNYIRQRENILQHIQNEEEYIHRLRQLILINTSTIVERPHTTNSFLFGSRNESLIARGRRQP